jgi:hypothetical protein
LIAKPRERREEKTQRVCACIYIYTRRGIPEAKRIREGEKRGVVNFGEEKSLVKH